MNKILEFLKHIKLPNFGKLKMIKFPKFRQVPIRAIILLVVSAVVAIALFIFMRGFTACWQLTALPGIAPDSCASTQNPTGAFTPTGNKGSKGLPPKPEVPAPVVQYPEWDGGSRINIVFFGLRGGPTSGEGCPKCTDTIIVFTIDPVSKTAGMISIPRDLYVNIPGFGFSRINEAWTDGEGAKLPGGGPGLAMKTVSQVVGVPIDYYVQVSFDTFVSFVNMIGGVDVRTDESIMDPKKGLRLDPLGNDLPNGVKTKSLNNQFIITCCGVRHLDGQRALAFARCRDVSQGCIDGDVGRSVRQQKVILGLRDKVLNPKEFTKLMTQGPQLYNLFATGIKTNISLGDAIKLAPLLKDIPVEGIKQGVLDNSMTTLGNVTLGGQNASILMPIPDKIRVLRDQIFTIGGATSPMAIGDEVKLMSADQARILVTNDTFTAGLDARTGNYLRAVGMNVIGLGGSTGGLDQTTLVVYSPKLYALRYLIHAFGITSSNQILFKPNTNQGVDIEVRIGTDWINRLPAGY